MGAREALTARFAPAWHFLSGGQGTVEQRVTVTISTRR